MTPRPAVFLDRDGTLVDDPGYLADPELAKLFPGAGEALARLAAAGYALVVVTNQSGIGRGFFSEDDFHRVTERVGGLLAEAGATLDGTYFCPHDPDGPPCSCRKPGVELYLKAQSDLGLALAQSWWVGDRMTDLAPAAALGGRALLVETGMGTSHVAHARAAGIPSVPTLVDAAGWILDHGPAIGD